MIPSLSRSHCTAAPAMKMLPSMANCGVASSRRRARRQQLVLRDRLAQSGMHQRETAGAVSVLRKSGPEAGLPEQCRLLIARDAGDRNLGSQMFGCGGADDGAGGNDSRQHRARDAEDVQQFVIPFAGRQIHQHGARGVGIDR